jgi:hypothetical protein
VLRRRRRSTSRSRPQARTAPDSCAFVDGQYVYNLAGKALPDPSGTYRIEMTLPNDQVVTASFSVKP